MIYMIYIDISKCCIILVVFLRMVHFPMPDRINGQILPRRKWPGTAPGSFGGKEG